MEGAAMDGHLHTSHDPRRLTLVLPAFNEEAGIRQAVVEADEALAALVEDYEVLVVDDGSRDATAAVVASETMHRPHVHLLRHPENRGYGAALRTGFEAARFDLIAFTDADCQFYLADLGRLLPLTDSYPVVAGYREKRQDSWRRCFLSRGYNLLTRTLLGTRVRDCDCALKVFRRDELADLLPQTSGFFVNAEMLTRARQHGYGIAEAGVRHRPRLRGASKVSRLEVPRTLATLLPFWWSRVLFQGTASGGRQPPDSGRLYPERTQNHGADAPRSPKAADASRSPNEANALNGLSWILLLALAALLFLTRLRAPLLEPQESRYAEIPRQMLEEGRWLVPTLHGQPYLDKPPLLYWLVIGAYRLFGAHDWAARLVPGLAGVATVLLTFWWGRRALGVRAGFCGAVALCLSAEFVYRARMLTMDPLLCLWVVAALACAHAALSGHALRRRWWLAAAAACGLGLLTKGPVALALVAVPVAAFRFLDQRCPKIRIANMCLFLVFAAGLAAPWYLAVAVQEPGFAGYFFWTHNVQRFLAPFDHAKPAWFYLPGLLAGLLPWTLLLPGLVRFLGRRSQRCAARRPAGLGFLLLSCVWCLLFFSASGCKRAGYVLPALPPLALALGCYIDALIPRFVSRLEVGWAELMRWGCRPAYRAAAVSLLVGLGLLAAASVRQMVKPGMVLLMGAAAIVTLAILWRRRSLSWGGCGLVVFSVLLLSVLHLQPAYNRQFALRGRLRADADLADISGLPVVCYPQRWDSVSFYLPRADVRTYGSGQWKEMVVDLRSRPQTLLLVKSGPVLQTLLRELPDSVEFVPRGRPGAVTAGWIRLRQVAPPYLYAAGQENVIKRAE
jgi:dolichol-phosphate mannosyltransferase